MSPRGLSFSRSVANSALALSRVQSIVGICSGMGVIVSFVFH
jgi:hypothetical protein